LKGFSTSHRLLADPVSGRQMIEASEAEVETLLARRF